MSSRFFQLVRSLQPEFNARFLAENLSRSARSYYSKCADMLTLKKPSLQQILSETRRYSKYDFGVHAENKLQFLPCLQKMTQNIGERRGSFLQNTRPLEALTDEALNSSKLAWADFEF